MIGSWIITAVTDLMDLVFASRRIWRIKNKTERFPEEFESLRLTFLIHLRGTLGLTSLLGSLLIDFQVKLDSTSLLNRLEARLEATLDFTGLLRTSKTVLK